MEKNAMYGMKLHIVVLTDFELLLCVFLQQQ